ncbi:MAG: 1-acyl-sn-glycerol-3-phosphate acyltransferase [Acidimicrobiales bacterium]
MSSKKIPGRLRRRAVTVPAMFTSAGLYVVSAPLLVPVLALADLIGGIRRRRFLRAWAFAGAYLYREVVGLTTLGLLWVLSGFGLAMGRRRFQNAHHALQRWWVGGLARAMIRIFGMDLRVSGTEQALPAPAIVIARHISLGDALMPTFLVAVPHRIALLHTFKQDLAWDPCLDLVGHRAPHHFVDRSPRDRESELAPIRELGGHADHETSIAIFPEGTFRTPERFERAIARLGDSDPAAAEAARKLEYLLPPRPAGTFALMQGAPDADLVILGHTGFEPFSSLPRTWRNIPFRSPVHARLWRIPRAEVPEDPGEFARYLLDVWLEMDRWIGERRREDDGAPR